MDDLKLITVVIVTFLIILKAIISLKVGNFLISTMLALIVSAIISYLVYEFRRYKLKITRFDKEDIYQRICKNLINKKKDL